MKAVQTGICGIVLEPCFFFQYVVKNFPLLLNSVDCFRTNVSVSLPGRDSVEYDFLSRNRGFVTRHPGSKSAADDEILFDRDAVVLVSQFLLYIQN